jgi:hypothetical protein
MTQTSTSSNKGRAFGIFLLCAIALMLGGMLIYANNRSSTSYYSSGSEYPEYTVPKTAEELRAELLEKEQTTPSKQLSVDGKHWRNFIDQLVVEGDITNTASLASFKDPVLTIEWFSKTGTSIGQESYKVYEFVKPGRKTHYKLKMNVPSSVKTIGVVVTDAVAVQ